MNSLKFFIKIFLFYILFLLIIIPLWLNKKFGDVYFDQFILNIQLAWHGYLGGDHNLVKSFYKWMIFIPLFLSLLLNFIKIIVYDLTSENQIITNNFKIYFFKIISYFKKYKILNIILFIFKKKLDVLILVIIIVASFYFNSLIFKNTKVLNNNNFIDDNYISFKSSSENSFNKNLILIYVESLENTFSKNKLFGENLLKNLLIENKNEKTIEKYHQVTGYGYSLASLVATQCGIPLKPLGILSSSNTETFKKFLPNIDCLSDLLKNSNYYNVFITSDDLKGSGFLNFTNTHHFDEVFGLDELYNLGFKTSKTAWHNKNNWYGGIHDDELLKFTINKIKQLDNEKKQYFLTVFTLDTHAPEGYLNPKCETNNKDFNIKDVVKCTVKELELFIYEFKKLNLKNTNLVILGDHLFMDGTDGFKNNEYFNTNERYVYNKFISTDEIFFNRDYMNFFDLYPSLVEFAGYEIKEGKLGLGFSIFNNFNEKEYIFSDGDFLNKLEGNSDLYNSFWINE